MTIGVVLAHVFCFVFVILVRMRVDSYTLANYSFTYVKSFMGYHVTTEYNGYDVWEESRCCTCLLYTSDAADE